MKYLHTLWGWIKSACLWVWHKLVAVWHWLVSLFNKDG